MLEQTRRLFCRHSKFILSSVAGSLPVMALLAVGAPELSAQAAKFEFGIIGDTPYSLKQEPS